MVFVVGGFWFESFGLLSERQGEKSERQQKLIVYLFTGKQRQSSNRREEKRRKREREEEGKRRYWGGFHMGKRVRCPALDPSFRLFTKYTCLSFMTPPPILITF